MVGVDWFDICSGYPCSCIHHRLITLLVLFYLLPVLCLQVSSICFRFFLPPLWHYMRYRPRKSWKIQTQTCTLSGFKWMEEIWASGYFLPYHVYRFTHTAHWVLLCSLHSEVGSNNVELLVVASYIPFVCSLWYSCYIFVFSTTSLQSRYDFWISFLFFFCLLFCSLVSPIQFLILILLFFWWRLLQTFAVRSLDHTLVGSLVLALLPFYFQACYASGPPVSADPLFPSHII